MSMLEWAKKEVELACKKENPNRKEGEFDYGCACYESALKAFNSLMEDGHSGLSMSLTKGILNRLLSEKPLTPIENTNNVWEFSFEHNGKRVYQCTRMSSLFKKVYSDGKTIYEDNEKFLCVDVDKPDVCYSSKLINGIMNEYCPVKFPYFPNRDPIKVFCDEFLVDPRLGNFDTIGILFYVDPENGLRRDVNRFFKLENDKEIEISFSEYILRKHKTDKRPIIHTPFEIRSGRRKNE